jgi:hypothetical protein
LVIKRHLLRVCGRMPAITGLQIWFIGLADSRDEMIREELSINVFDPKSFSHRKDLIGTLLKQNPKSYSRFIKLKRGVAQIS